MEILHDDAKPKLFVLSLSDCVLCFSQCQFEVYRHKAPA